MWCICVDIRLFRNVWFMLQNSILYSSTSKNKRETPTNVDFFVKSVVQCENETKVELEHSFRLVMEIQRGRHFSSKMPQLFFSLNSFHHHFMHAMPLSIEIILIDRFVIFVVLHYNMLHLTRIQFWRLYVNTHRFSAFICTNALLLVLRVEFFFLILIGESVHPQIIEKKRNKSRKIAHTQRYTFIKHTQPHTQKHTHNKNKVNKTKMDNN